MITNRIQCEWAEPRVVPAPGEVDIFALQEKVIASIVQGAQEQVALEEAPKMYDIFKKKEDGCIKVVMKPNATGRTAHRAPQGEGLNL